MRKFKVLFPILMIFALVACAHTQKVLNNAKVSAYSAYTFFDMAYNVIDDMSKSPSPEIQAIAEKAKPIYNNGVDCLHEYIKLVNTWEKTGFKPENFDEVSDRLSEIIADLRAMLFKKE